MITRTSQADCVVLIIDSTTGGFEAGISKDGQTQRASGLRPYHFTYPEKRLTMEEMLYKFIDEGKREQEEMRAFIHDFRTTNELLFKERNNSLNMLEDSRVPIVLGRPFLATDRAMIDMFNKKITLRERDDEVIFDMDQSIKRSPAKDDECYRVDDLDDAINAEAQELLANDMSDSFLLKGLEKSIDQSDLESCKSSECKVVDDSDSGE
ncbi:hypothetical protein Tco_0765051 [Tanacetum coccineum]